MSIFEEEEELLLNYLEWEEDNFSLMSRVSKKERVKEYLGIKNQEKTSVLGLEKIKS